ncbi:N-acetylmuramoyl-L-alanine amidase [Streptomyces abyssalis]|uniref:N-acetylmuramoyl-L-alanine amidase n=2 Tax=Streptomyces abyssalis TaxID=933944 RepID=A0A1E7JKD7_9ACTN|nr:N-acetylmuramoyl-L-alanine amidase [Streptomyces abyssalis]OEU90982.1 N-acetylmuramoyl-L-alanine amidase [Streptomyces abyssalis]
MRLLITLGVLIPTSFAGWLVWQSADQSSGAGKTGPTLMPLPDDSRENSGSGASGGDTDGGGGPQDGNGGKPLAGMTVVIDPGHNPNNRRHAAEISRSVNIGTGRKACDTTGTATASGYSEADFTLDLARRVRAGLRERGATVELTHQGRRPWGPCVNARAEAGNRADADAAVSLHADGAPSGARGFHVILPESVNEGKADTRAIAGPSRNLGRELADAFREFTGSKPAAYAGDGEGTDTRGDLGGLNLTRVPKVFLECGNMRDPQDAADLTDRKWRDRAARGVVEGIAGFLAKKP